MAIQVKVRENLVWERLPLTTAQLLLLARQCRTSRQVSLRILVHNNLFLNHISLCLSL
jgi:hypothetical protein